MNVASSPATTKKTIPQVTYITPRRLWSTVVTQPCSTSVQVRVLPGTAAANVWSAEAIGGIAGITGAFIVGLLLAQTPYKNDIEQGVAAIAYGFFVPIFFVNIGLGVDLAAISGSAWLFAIILTVVAILSKIIGCGFGGRLGGLNNRESLQLGIGMVSRGEVGLIVAAFALAQGALSGEAFSITVFMVIIATLVTPPMLRAAFRRQPREEKEEQTHPALGEESS